MGSVIERPSFIESDHPSPCVFSLPPSTPCEKQEVQDRRSEAVQEEGEGRAIGLRTVTVTKEVTVPGIKIRDSDQGR